MSRASIPLPELDAGQDWGHGCWSNTCQPSFAAAHFSNAAELPRLATSPPALLCCNSVLSTTVSTACTYHRTTSISCRMRFGRTLRAQVYPPWKDKYIDYGKLKTLLREDETTPQGEEAREWTEQDEEAFVQELVNVQLDMVNQFQVDTYKSLRDRTSECEAKLEPVAVSATNGEEPKDAKAIAEEILKELDSISKEVSELEKYARLNFTGFLKAAKKHDRKRGTKYRVRPILQVRLSQLPFNSEDYSPLLYRLSTMYSFARQTLSGDESRTESTAGPRPRETYTAHKFWVHPDNLLEVKTYILRRLPVLVYNPQSEKIVDSSHKDPVTTSIYFDNPAFKLYTQKVDKADEAGSLRLRWSGQLNDKPEINMEKKLVSKSTDSKELRISIKEKYIQPFLKGEYKMEKQMRKLEERHGIDSEEVKTFKSNVDEIQDFLRENKLEPMLRASYTRTAFQIPGDSRIRISLDTDLALIREDALDPARPCRDPDEWHRLDIDQNEMEYPFSSIKKGEIYRFPFAILEIKVKDTKATRSNAWLADLMNSHLVKEAPQFSKFVHGVAQLFEDSVNSFPFWLSYLESDIRRDPETAFQEEQQKQAKKAEDEFAVGSFLPGRKCLRRPLSRRRLAHLTSSRTTRRMAHGLRPPDPSLTLPSRSMIQTTMGLRASMTTSRERLRI